MLLEHRKLNQKPISERQLESFNTWRLNNIQNFTKVLGQVSREIKKIFELNAKENTNQNLQDEVKVVLRRKFTALNAYINK